jgi:hypothetical protein
LHGLSAREALRLLTRLGIATRMSGDGFVVDQTPAAGAELTGADRCVLRLVRRSTSSAGGLP